MSKRVKNNTADLLAIGGPKLSLKTDSLQLVKSVTYNIRQDLIVITRDKVELCLSKHVKMMERRQAWLIPFGIFLSTLTAAITSTFHDWMGIKGNFWGALFYVATVISLAWSIVLFLGRQKAKSIDQVIDDLQSQGIQETLRMQEQITEVTSLSASIGNGQTLGRMEAEPLTQKPQ